MKICYRPVSWQNFIAEASPNNLFIALYRYFISRVLGCTQNINVDLDGLFTTDVSYKFAYETVISLEYLGIRR